MLFPRVCLIANFDLEKRGNTVSIMKIPVPSIRTLVLPIPAIICLRIGRLNTKRQLVLGS